MTAPVPFDAALRADMLAALDRARELVEAGQLRAVYVAAICTDGDGEFLRAGGSHFERVGLLHTAIAAECGDGWGDDEPDCDN